MSYFPIEYYSAINGKYYFIVQKHGYVSLSESQIILPVYIIFTTNSRKWNLIYGVTEQICGSCGWTSWQEGAAVKH